MTPRKQPLAPFGDLPDDAFARVEQIIPHVIPVGRSTWWRMVKQGRAPSPVRPSPGVTAWRVGSLRQWIRERSAAVV